MLEDRDKLTRYEQVKYFIQTKIKNGEYKIGEKIPSLAKLCTNYQTSLITVRRAILELVSEGLLKTVTGKGIFVISSKKRNNDTKQNNLIGLIFTEMYVNTFYMELFHGIEKTLNSFGYKLIVSTTGDNPERECQIILELKEKNVDGIIMTLSTVNRTLSADNILKDLSRENFPIVFIDRKFSGFSIDYVGSNNEEGGYIATRYLLNLGHKRIGFILGVGGNTSQGKYSGYKRALSEFNIPLDPIIIKRSYIELQYAESGYSNTLDILQLANPPTALFVASDLHAMGVYRACYELNIKIPDDLSIVGYDNISYGEYLNPPLTTIHQSKYEMSEIACKLLLDRIRGEKSEPKEIFLDTRLIERASCSKYKKYANVAIL